MNWKIIIFFLLFCYVNIIIILEGLKLHSLALLLITGLNLQKRLSEKFPVVSIRSVRYERKDKKWVVNCSKGKGKKFPKYRFVG